VFYDSYDKKGWLLLLTCYEAIETIKQQTKKNSNCCDAPTNHFLGEAQVHFFYMIFKEARMLRYHGT
jgi:hypothetical protein